MQATHNGYQPHHDYTAAPAPKPKKAWRPKPPAGLCHCGLNVNVFQVKKEGVNKGKFFQCCPRQKEDPENCELFQWCQAAPPEESTGHAFGGYGGSGSQEGAFGGYEEEQASQGAPSSQGTYSNKRSRVEQGQTQTHPPTNTPIDVLDSLSALQSQLTGQTAEVIALLTSVVEDLNAVAKRQKTMEERMDHISETLGGIKGYLFGKGDK